MNDLALKISRNDTARLVRSSNRIGNHRNCVRISTGNSLEHEIAKLKKCYELLKEGKEFLTEAIFENGTRADILVLDDGIAIEIVCSEKEESLEKKAANYPVEMEVIRIG